MNALAITNGTATRMAVIAQRTGSELMAGAKAMMIESLKEKLRNGVAHFLFIKKDGSIREAFGTTNAAVATKYTNGNGYCSDARNVVSFIDIDAEGNKWRSFRYEKLISWE